MSQGYRYSLRRAAYVVLAMSSLLAPRFGLLRAQTATVTQDGPVMDGVQDVHFSRLTSQDVVRHKLVGRIVDAYEKYDNRDSHKRK